MTDTRSDLQRAFDEGYEKGKADRPSAVDLSSVYSTAYKSGYEKGKADRPQGWIPCSERLPKDEGIFLVTTERYVFSEYSHPVGTSFYSPSFGWLNANPNKVLAWMPLPKPWKGADDESVDSN